MKRKYKDTKPKFKYVTPKAGQRFSLPYDFDQSDENKRMIENKNTFKHESYLRVKHKVNKEYSLDIHLYSTFLAQIFSKSFFDLTELKTKKIVKVWLYPFWVKYKDAYLQGRDYFQKTFTVSSEVLYGNNGKLLERTLHTHYYHTNFENNFEGGWRYWETHSPFHLEFETMQRYGYYAGIISSLYEYMRLHPIIFSKFSVCKDLDKHDGNATSKRPDPDIEDLKRIDSENVFNSKMSAEIPIKYFEPLWDLGYITKKDFIKFIKSGFFGFKYDEKINMNFKPGTKGKVIRLFYMFYNNSVPLEKTSHLRDKYIRLLTDNFSEFDFSTVKNNFR